MQRIEADGSTAEMIANIAESSSSSRRRLRAALLAAVEGGRPAEGNSNEVMNTIEMLEGLRPQL